MVNDGRIGLFGPDIDSRAWFDKDLIPEAWFDADLISVPSVAPLVEAFIAVKPPEAPHYDHDDVVGTATVDFLTLAFVVALALRRLRGS